MPTIDQPIIPEEYAERFRSLRPGRRTIIMRYFQIRRVDPRSPYHIIPHIAEHLGYTIDQNGSNSYLLQVIREFLGRRERNS